MALADDKDHTVNLETLEGRQLYAFQPVGSTGTLVATGATAVESATVSPNNTRYATVLTGTGGSVVPVTGPDDSTPSAAIPLTTVAGATISNTDVAANVGNRTVVVAYQVTTTTGNGGGGPTQDNDIYVAQYVNGTINGAPVRVNTTLAGNQTDCRVAMDGSGNFVVVWQSTSGVALVGRRFNADGSPNGGEFTIAIRGVEPNVAANASGEFIVTYAGTTGTMVQLYNANGTVIGTPITVSTENFTEPGIALADNGRFVVAWATEATSSTRTVVAQRYNANGTSIGAAFNVSSTTGLNQDIPDVAFDNAGGFAIAYAQASTGTNYDSAAFRVYRNNGVAYDVETVIGGVTLAVDHRFGMAYRTAGTIHIAYVDGTGAALIQQYTDDSGTLPGGNGEVAVPTGALLIDLSAGLNTGTVLIVEQTSTQIQVSINGTQTNYTKSLYTSIYVRGSDYNDYLLMKPSVTLPTYIYGRAGGDTIYGGNGVDLIDGGDSGFLRDALGAIVLDDLNRPTVIANAIQARNGDDYVYGGLGNDTIFGGGGGDRMLGGPGINIIYGEDGADTLLGGNRGDAIYGGTNNDSIFGNDGDDNIDGGLGNDTLDGGDGRDRIFGNNGADFVEGGAGNDVINGGRGNDTLFGNTGRDTLFGGAGFDLLRGGGIDIRNGNGGGGFNNEDITTDRTTEKRLDIYYYDLIDTLYGEATRILVP